ncbi:hypothetical protein PhCBS80983_g05175 [Powellomyces hirtus]|uniref:phosphoribosylglycinamide formyltransferase 1 n=1 Tax=Powellomyces hirtus TaxID=109895 RepID=A0A507DV51_9FUNG|nr:hypothetical protein PhCBS80983_g05175 [Powellomyces hirtus]
MSSSAALPRIVVLISGSGSNLQALLDAVQNNTLRAQIALVVSNRKGAYGLTRAANAGVPTLVVSLKQFKDAGKSRVDFDLEVARQIREELRRTAPASGGGETDAGAPDLVVLAGWMHILSSEFIQQFPAGRMINLHPALPGAFDGAHAIDRAFQAFQNGTIKETGVMIHKVIPEVDRGEVVLQEVVPIKSDDTLASLEDRIHAVEHRLIVEGARAMLAR